MEVSELLWAHLVEVTGCPVTAMKKLELLPTDSVEVLGRLELLLANGVEVPEVLNLP